MAKRVTLSTIAKVCNTSIGTVNRALTGKTDINPDTKAYILQVAQQLGYRQAGAFSGSRTLRIGVITCRHHNYFHNSIARGIEDAQEELRDVGVQITPIYTEYLEQSAQAELLSSLDISQFDALLINSAGRSTSENINRLVEQGLPVATFNTDASGSKRLFFCGANSYASGRLGGGLLAKLISGRGKVAVFGNFSGNESWSERFCGFYSVLKEDFPEVELVPILQYYSNDVIAFEAIKKLLVEQPDICGLFPTNFSCTLGTLRALVELERKDVVVVGYDISPYIIECLQNGYCDAVLYQNPYNQGYIAVKAIVQYLTDGTLPSAEQTDISSRIILKYNIGNIID